MTLLDNGAHQTADDETHAVGCLKIAKNAPGIHGADEITSRPGDTRDQPHFGIVSLTIMPSKPRIKRSQTKPPNKHSQTKPTSKYSQTKDKDDPTSSLPEGVLETIPLPTLEGSEEDIVPKDLVYIGSYNWVDSPKPTIVVPGQRIWFIACIDPS